MSRKKTRPQELFHGGVAGLRPRDQVLPASELPSGLPAEYGSSSGMYEYALPEFVYLTADRSVARAYAARWQGRSANGAGGSLYSVQVKGPLEPDPDYRHDPGVCWRARIAFVTKVEETEVTMTAETLLSALRLVWWDDDTTRMFSPEGYAVPSEVARIAGVTEADLKHLGKCPDPAQVRGVADRLARQRLADPCRAKAVLEWTQERAPERVPEVRRAIRAARS